MRLTSADVIFLEARGVHCPLHAKNVIQKVIEIKRAKRQLDQQLSILAGLCQQVLVNKSSFKKLYKSAYCQGLFEKKDSLTVRHMLT